jgi:hypothetical protein
LIQTEVMSDSRFFCAAESRGNGESVYGTVARIRSWLLLEYQGVWRRRAIEDSLLLPDEVKRYIRVLEQHGGVDRSLLIRREHKRSGPLHCFSVLSCEDRPRMSQVLLSDYEELPKAQASATPVDGLMFAVCTHGGRDKCCAKFGLPVYAAFRNRVGERAWQCSHVGGDRFAGNVVVFPHGIYYGRVGPQDVPEIVRRSELGEVWLPGYRGRSCFRRAVQVAEYFARAESGRVSIDEFRPVETVQTEDGTTQVRFEARSDGAMHLVEFRTKANGLRQRLTCEATELSPVPQYELQGYRVLGS